MNKENGKEEKLPDLIEEKLTNDDLKDVSGGHIELTQDNVNLGATITPRRIRGDHWA